MTTLVVGSSGHLGEGLVRLLRQEGKAVRGFDLKPSDFTDLVGDLADPQAVASAFQGVTRVINTATLHKPHVETHSRQAFIDTNISGTLNLLEAASSHGVESFVYCSTTSTFGDALRPKAGEPAVWIDETVLAQPKNIYGVTKTAAEDPCQLFWKLKKLPTLVLKLARFFPEEDDSPAVRAFCSSDNAKTNELLYRRADLFDMATACLAASEAAPSIGFDKFIISAPSPFQRVDLGALAKDAASVVKHYYPTYGETYQAVGWRMFESIGRVYRSDRAQAALNWTPTYTFEKALKTLAQGDDLRSPLARAVGVKGYHEEVFEDGPYPVS